VDRLFVSMDLPQAIKEAAGIVQKRLRETGADVSWTRPEGMHLTLKFLGDVEKKRLQDIQAALTETGGSFHPITIAREGLGGFPTLDKPREIWLGLKEPSGELIGLQKRMDRALALLGFPQESRDFHPHLTLGRVRSHRDGGALLQALKVLDPVRLGEWRLGEINLMQSALRPGGSVYTKLWTVKAVKIDNPNKM